MIKLQKDEISKEIKFNPRKTGVCEYLERPGAPLSIFNLEALNGPISYVVYSLGYI